jgi:transcriptional regulator with XRE-family HTH domain
MKVATNQERLNELFDSDPRNDTAIANTLGVSKQSISMWRNGSRSPKKSVLIEIAKEFNVSIEWLMGFDVERNPQAKTFSIPDSKVFTKILNAMTPSEYYQFTELLDKVQKRLKEKGEI